MNPSLTLSSLRAPVSPRPPVTSWLVGRPQLSLGPDPSASPDLPPGHTHPHRDFPAGKHFKHFAHSGTTVPKCHGGEAQPRGLPCPHGALSVPKCDAYRCWGGSQTHKGAQTHGDKRSSDLGGVWGQEGLRPTGWWGQLGPTLNLRSVEGPGELRPTGAPMWGEGTDVLVGGVKPIQGVQTHMGEGQIHTGPPL